MRLIEIIRQFLKSLISRKISSTLKSSMAERKIIENSVLHDVSNLDKIIDLLD